MPTIDQVRDFVIILGLALTAWNTYKGLKPKTLLDDSSAAVNFQKTVIELQGENAEMKKAQKENRRMIEELQERENSASEILTEYMRGTKILITQLQRERLTPDWLPPIHADKPTRPRTGGFAKR